MFGYDWYIFKATLYIWTFCWDIYCAHTLISLRNWENVKLLINVLFFYIVKLKYHLNIFSQFSSFFSLFLLFLPQTFLDLLEITHLFFIKVKMERKMFNHVPLVWKSYNIKHFLKTILIKHCHSLLTPKFCWLLQAIHCMVVLVYVLKQVNMNLHICVKKKIIS